MNDSVLFSPLKEAAEYQKLAECIRGGVSPCSVFGLPESAKCHMAAALKQERPLLFLTYSEARAEKISQDLSFYLGIDAPVLPARQVVLHQTSSNGRLAVERVRCLNRALAGHSVFVACVDALLYPLAPPALFGGLRRTLCEGARIDLLALAQAARGAGYVAVDRVEDRGQFSVRGGIFDFYGADDDAACRIELFDDEIDSIRAFDPQTQRSTARLKEAILTPVREAVADETLREAAAERLHAQLISKRRTANYEETRTYFAELEERMRTDNGVQWDALIPYLYDTPALFFEYMPDNTLVVLDEPRRMSERAENARLEFDESYKVMLEAGRALPGEAEAMCHYAHVLSSLGSRQLITFQMLTATVHDITPRALFTFTARAMQSFGGREEQFIEELRHYYARGYTVIILAGGKHKAERLSTRLVEAGLDVTGALGGICVLPGMISQGFEYAELRLAVLAESDIFGVQATHRKATGTSRRLDPFVELAVGDYVVHETHGIGIYEGIQKITTEGIQRDYLAIRYIGAEKLYVPVESMDAVQKYIGAGEEKPKISRLGSQEWANTKRKVKASIREMAGELIKLYAQRQSTAGHAFAPDTPWQRQFEDDFPYEETPDQLQSISEIKSDMESGRVMDRLLCGDVGYGKTEVAIRAAFKAVMDGKQVAFLCPTTILAQQHYNTLSQRLFAYGIRCDVLSRFRTANEQKVITGQLKEGTLDIIVGTHRLLGKDIAYKDLGLLIIDEEQRFGVAHKEKIKKLKANIDVLTLSATPIPRTLHMAISGIRDLSVIETPPEDRFPVQTYVLEYSETLVRDAVMREIARGGQVFFLYNNVMGMDHFQQYLQALLRDVRIVSAHGQMGEHQLEKTMAAFYAGEADVLLCTTIIESGLDIPSVNTIIIYDADHFGLSQLYQLRGRVGRSNRLAYAYLMYRRDSILTETAEKRLAAIRDFTALGSGFKIAMRDLEIRGAGNLLGGEQHGHMSSVGYDMYCKLLQEAVGELRGNETQATVEPKIELKIEAYIPDTYIKDEIQKIQMYKRIASIVTSENRLDVEDEFIDRFGEPPVPVRNLLKIAQLKGVSQTVGVGRISDKGGYLQADFVYLPQLEALARAVEGQPDCHLNAGGAISLAVRKNKTPIKVLTEVLTAYARMREK